mmetsp:Transcript_131375/g.366283  ORF Transcript_131375/g.366283 Transcript_131375/m.366283 type:complete len:237 (+) Transcript_131375:128-838(+)
MIKLVRSRIVGKSKTSVVGRAMLSNSLPSLLRKSTAFMLVMPMSMSGLSAEMMLSSPAPTILRVTCWIVSATYEASSCVATAFCDSSIANCSLSAGRDGMTVAARSSTMNSCCRKLARTAPATASPFRSSACWKIRRPCLAKLSDFFKFPSAMCKWACNTSAEASPRTSPASTNRKMASSAAASACSNLWVKMYTWAMMQSALPMPRASPSSSLSFTACLAAPVALAISSHPAAKA